MMEYLISSQRKPGIQMMILTVFTVARLKTTSTGPCQLCSVHKNNEEKPTDMTGN